jgi:hypothetical protein
MYTVYDRVYGDFPAKNTVYTLYIHLYAWFWPTLDKTDACCTNF